jgi:hypothetical protein
MKYKDSRTCVVFVFSYVLTRPRSASLNLETMRSALFIPYLRIDLVNTWGVCLALDKLHS